MELLAPDEETIEKYGDSFGVYMPMNKDLRAFKKVGHQQRAEICLSWRHGIVSLCVEGQFDSCYRVYMLQ